MAISVDDALAQLGGFGLFQWLILLAASLCEMIDAYQILLLSFIAVEPKWSCINGSTTCNLTGAYGVGDEGYGVRCNVPRSQWYFHDDFTSIVTEFDLVCEDSILATVSTTLIFGGWLISGISFGYISDRFGRKVAFLYSVINTTLIPLAGAFSNSLWLFTISRVLCGTGLGAGAARFVLLSEFSGVKYRGTMGLMYWFSWILGYMSLALIAFLVRDWRHLTIVTSSIGIPSFIAWWFFPESVRWYLVKNKITKANNELKKIARCNRRPQLKEDLIKPEEEQKVRFQDLFSTLTMRKYTLLSCFIWNLYFWLREVYVVCLTDFIVMYRFIMMHNCAEMQFWPAIFEGAVNAAVYYGVSFSSVSLGGNMYLNFFISAVVEIPANIIGLLLLNRLGRKPCVLYGMIIACILSIGAVVCQLFEKEEEVTDGYWMTRIFISMGAKLAITVSFNVVWIWSNELFPTVVRNLGMGLTSSLARIGSFSSGYIIWLARVHILIPYAIFGSLAFLASIACYFLPETANQPTRETVDFDNKLASGKVEQQGIDNVVIQSSPKDQVMTATSKLANEEEERLRIDNNVMQSSLEDEEMAVTSKL